MHDDLDQQLEPLEGQLRAMTPADPAPEFKERLAQSLQARGFDASSASDNAARVLHVTPIDRRLAPSRWRYALAAALALVGGVLLVIVFAPGSDQSETAGHTSAPADQVPHHQPNDGPEPQPQPQPQLQPQPESQPSLSAMATLADGPPNVFRLQQAFRQSPEALDALLDRQAVRISSVPRRRVVKPAAPLIFADARQWAQLELESSP